MKSILIFSLILGLISCGASVKRPETTTDTVLTDTSAADGTIRDTPVISPTKEPEPSQQLKTFKGLYISGNEISTFQDCNNPGHKYWVEDESTKLQSSYKKAAGFLSYPYESVYVEVKGYLKGKFEKGYAGEYENVLAVKEVTSATQKSFTTDCFNFEFLALGNEPFWSLDIIPSEKIIALKDVGADKTYTFPYKAPKKSDNRTDYLVSNDKRENLKVVLVKESCSDGMSDRKYSYSALVTINGKTLKGCAIKKGDKLN